MRCSNRLIDCRDAERGVRESAPPASPIIIVRLLSLHLFVWIGQKFPPQPDSWRGMRTIDNWNAGSTDSRTPLFSCYVMDRFCLPAFALLGWLLIV